MKANSSSHLDVSEGINHVNHVSKFSSISSCMLKHNLRKTSSISACQSFTKSKFLSKKRSSTHVVSSYVRNGHMVKTHIRNSTKKKNNLIQSSYQKLITMHFSTWKPAPCEEDRKIAQSLQTKFNHLYLKSNTVRIGRLSKQSNIQAFFTPT